MESDRGREIGSIFGRLAEPFDPAVTRLQEVREWTTGGSAQNVIGESHAQPTEEHSSL